MVLSPNDEEVASSKKHTQFKTKVHKPYAISDQNGRNWYLFQTKTAKKLYPLAPHMPLYSLYKGVPPEYSRMSLAAYASETNNVINDGLI